MKISDLSPVARKRLFLVLVVVVPIIILAITITAVSAAIQVPPSAATDAAQNALDVPMLALSSMLAVTLTSIAASYALARSGVAAISSLVEKPEGFFKAFLVVTLCEAIAIYGVVVAVLLWTRIPAI